jgi:hypothetical protein
MALAVVTLLAIVGLLIASAGLVLAMAVGLPALGLNRYGRNPLDVTVSVLATAAMLYGVGAALLVGTTWWMRTRRAPNLKGFAYTGSLIPVLLVWAALRGYWLTIPLVLFVVAGLFAPIAVGLRPWDRHLTDRPGS